MTRFLYREPRHIVPILCQDDMKLSAECTNVDVVKSEELILDSKTEAECALASNVPSDNTIVKKRRIAPTPILHRPQTEK